MGYYQYYHTDARNPAEKRTLIVPLKKSTSKPAFRANVKAEMAAGKPQKQAVAIAYSVKREAAKGKKK